MKERKKEREKERKKERKTAKPTKYPFQSICLAVAGGKIQRVSSLVPICTRHVYNNQATKAHKERS